MNQCLSYDTDASAGSTGLSYNLIQNYNGLCKCVMLSEYVHRPGFITNLHIVTFTAACEVMVTTNVSVELLFSGQ